MIRNILRIFERNELDRLLRQAARERKRRFLICWNRGLGDIALGIYGLVFRVKSFIPDAQITILTREELIEAFHLLAGTEVIGVPGWQRKKPIRVAETLQSLNLKREHYDVLLEETNPTKWLKWQIGKLTPKLTWKSEYDLLPERFNLDPSTWVYIGVHLNTETQQFYGANKDWPLANWEGLMTRMIEQLKARIILFGHHPTPFIKHPAIIDLRGETRLLEMLSIIKNCCKVLIAPDGGVLSLTYYLDVFFPLTVISLWGDAPQGILKQSVSSPNKGLIHIPLQGQNKDVSQITIDKVFEAVVQSTKSISLASS